MFIRKSVLIGMQDDLARLKEQVKVLECQVKVLECPHSSTIFKSYGTALHYEECKSCGHRVRYFDRTCEIDQAKLEALEKEIAKHKKLMDTYS